MARAGGRPHYPSDAGDLSDALAAACERRQKQLSRNPPKEFSRVQAVEKPETKIYVVSLPEAASRRSFMRAQLDAPDMPTWQFVDAVSESALTEAEIAKFYDVKNASPKLTRTEIACAISHANAVRLALSNKDEFAIILEDDALLSARFPEIVSGIEKFARLHKDCLCVLNCAQIYHRRGRARIGRDHYICKIHVAHGAQGYFVSRESAGLLLDFCTPITKNPDDWTHFKKVGSLDIRCVVPYCVGHGLIGRSSQIAHIDHKAPIEGVFGKLRKRLVYNFGFQMILEPVLALRRQKIMF
jgi:glycosyl transferase family 25